MNRLFLFAGLHCLIMLLAAYSHAQTRPLNKIDIPATGGHYYNQEEIVNFAKRARGYDFWVAVNARILLVEDYSVIPDDDYYARVPIHREIILNEGTSKTPDIILYVQGTFRESGVLMTSMDFRQDILTIYTPTPYPTVAPTHTPVPTPVPTPAPKRGKHECSCPEGFTVTPAKDGCRRETQEEPHRTGELQPVTPGDEDGLYFSGQVYFAEVTKQRELPLVSNDFSPTMNSRGKPLPYQTGNASLFRQRVLGPDRITIRNGAAADNQWYTKTFCMDLSEQKKYVLNVGGDNAWEIRIDGKPFSQCTSQECFKDGHFLAQVFSSGRHYVELRYINYGGPGAVWFEIYNNSLEELQKATSMDQLQVLHSTKELVGQNWDGTKDLCSDGTVYDPCKSNKCVKVETTACQ